MTVESDAGMRPDVQSRAVEMNQPRVIYVVDDDGDLRRSLHFFLETRGICVSPFSSGAQFLTELDTLQPAPIILDVRMTGIDGLEVLARLRAMGNEWPVVMLSAHGEIAVAVQSLKAGAIDFLQKPVPASTLHEAVLKAFGRLDDQTISGDFRKRAREALASLTPREVEVIAHLCEGQSNKQVAFTLSISPRTVEMHRANALRQLGVRSLVEVSALRAAAGNAPT